MPEPLPPPVVTILPDPEVPSSDADLITPDTPERLASRGAASDTPPPADISSNGEISRPSRRARAAISYAEPNLRDKMRRPTKELLDAVAGERKYIHRPHKSDEIFPVSVTKAALEATLSDQVADLPMLEGAEEEYSRKDSTSSPVAGKQLRADAPPTLIAAERRKRPSAVSREPTAPSERSESRSAAFGENASPAATRGEFTTRGERRVDVYDFSSSSPMAEPKERPEDAEFKPHSSSRGSRKSTHL